ncbi:MAG: repressor LexA [Planctomycetes bacterium]|nr:repressor LexA [Planctomycetota bacterium]
MEKLTEQQGKILRFIKQFIETYEISPSIREISEKFGFRSTKAVQDHLAAIERKGYLKMLKKKARGIQIIKHGIPLLGYIQAGVPTAEDFSLDDYINIESAENIFALRVKGDSMQDAGIIEGDLLLAVKDPKVIKNYDLVIAQLNNEYTVKYFKKESGKAWLIPANKKYNKIEIKDDIIIIGKVLSVVRQYK